MPGTGTLPRRISAVLLDLSGTLHIDKTPLPGAVEAVRKLRSAGVPFRFATNTTKESCGRITGKLKGLGFEVKEGEIFTSLSACRTLVQQENLRPLLFLEDEALEDFSGIDTSEPYNAVVIGLSPSNFNYKKMNQAFRLLIDTPASLVAIHKSRYFADSDKKLSLGPGPFVEGLEYAVGKKARVVGKPERAFYELALNDLGIDTAKANEVVMIGDDVHTDLGEGARELGMVRCLVRTGKYRKGDENMLKFEQGEYGGVWDDIGSVVDEIVTMQEATI